MMPKTGDVLHVGKAASVQFWHSPILFRVIRVRHDIVTYEGWVYLDGYELTQQGDAVERRTIWVQHAGLRAVEPRVTRPVNRGPAIPRQRKPRTVDWDYHSDGAA